MFTKRMIAKVVGSAALVYSAMMASPVMAQDAQVQPAAVNAPAAADAVWPGAQFARLEKGCGDKPWCLTNESEPEHGVDSPVYFHQGLSATFDGSAITQVTLGFGKKGLVCGVLHATDPKFVLVASWGARLEWEDKSHKGLSTFPQLVGTGSVVITATAPSGAVSVLKVDGVTCGNPPVITETPTLTPTPTITLTVTVTPTVTSTPVITLTVTPTTTPTPEITETPVTVTPTESVTPTETPVFPTCVSIEVTNWQWMGSHAHVQIAATIANPNEGMKLEVFGMSSISSPIGAASEGRQSFMVEFDAVADVQYYLAVNGIVNITCKWTMAQVFLPSIANGTGTSTVTPTPSETPTPVETPAAQRIVAAAKDDPWCTMVVRPIDWVVSWIRWEDLSLTKCPWAVGEHHLTLDGHHVIIKVEKSQNAMLSFVTGVTVDGQPIVAHKDHRVRAVFGNLVIEVELKQFDGNDYWNIQISWIGWPTDWFIPMGQ